MSEQTKRGLPIAWICADDLRALRRIGAATVYQHKQVFSLSPEPDQTPLYAAAAGPPRESVERYLAALVGYIDGWCDIAIKYGVPGSIYAEQCKHMHNAVLGLRRVLAAPPAAGADKWQPLPDLERGEQAIELTSGPLQPAASADQSTKAEREDDWPLTCLTPLERKQTMARVNAELSAPAPAVDPTRVQWHEERTDPAASAAPEAEQWRCRKCGGKCGDDYEIWACVKGGHCERVDPPTPDDGRSDAELPGMLAVAKGVAEQTWPHTVDAKVWADKWIEITKDKPREAFNDHGWMLSWFANAIMAGYDTAQARAPAKTGGG